MKKTTILTLCTHKGLSRILSFYFRGHNAGFRETTATTTPFATFRGERENRVIVDMILGPLKPSARWCFVAAKLDFGSCLLGSTATFRQGSESNVGDSGLRPAKPAET